MFAGPVPTVDAPPAFAEKAHDLAEATPGGQWGRAWRAGAAYWLICHAAYLAIQLMSWRIDPAPETAARSLISEMIHSWVRLDGLRYVDIAQSGYHPVVDPTFRDPASVTPVWPPGYPILIRLASYVLPGDMSAAAIVVSNIAALGMLVVLYRLVDQELGEDNAHRTLLCLIAFPTTFFFAVAYSESVFMLLTVSALYCARRGKWWMAGILGAACSGTRVIGVTLAAALAYEYMRQRNFAWRKIRFDVLSIAMAPLGLVLYMAYLWSRFGDPLLFTHAQAHWGRGAIEMPWTTIAQSLRNVDLGGDRNLAVINIIDVASCLLGLAFLVLCFVGPWRLRFDQIYLIIAGALPFLTAVLQPLWIAHPSPLLSMDRYVLAFFPMFLVMGKMAANRYVQQLFLFLFLPLQAGLMLVFIQGGWAG